MDKIKDSFGIIIAFIIPGMIGLYAYALNDNRFKEIASSNLSVVDGLFSILLSLGIGLILYSAWAILFRIIGKYMFKFEFLNPEDTAKVDTKGKHDLGVKAMEENYRYYQFYGTTAIAILYLLVTSYSPNQSFSLTVTYIVAIVLCIPTSIFCYIEYRTRVKEMSK